MPLPLLLLPSRRLAVVALVLLLFLATCVTMGEATRGNKNNNNNNNNNSNKTQPACVPKTCASLGYQCLPAPIGDGCGGQINACEIGSCADYCTAMFGVTGGVCDAGTKQCACSTTPTPTPSPISVSVLIQNATVPPTPTKPHIVNSCKPLTCGQLQSLFICIPSGHIDACTGQVIDPTSCAPAVKMCNELCNTTWAGANSTCNTNGQGCTCDTAANASIPTPTPTPIPTPTSTSSASTSPSPASHATVPTHPTIVLHPSGTSTLGTGAIVGIAVGGGLALIVLLTVMYVSYNARTRADPVNESRRARPGFFGQRSAGWLRF